MSDFVSALLSLIGFGQQRLNHASQKRAEALKLSSEVVGLTGQLIDYLNIEFMRLDHRSMLLLPENPEIWAQGKEPMRKVVSDFQQALLKVEADRKQILEGGTLSIRKWDQVIGILSSQKAAIERETARQRQLIAQFHRIFDQVEQLPMEERNIY